MNVFWKIIGGIFAALILWIAISKHNKDFSVLLTMCICAMAILAIGVFLRPIIDFVEKLQVIGKLDNTLLSVIFKTVGIGVITEISVMICKDAGNESMGKTLQIVSAVTALWISIPVFEKLLDLLDRILGSV